jgi:hypothetical protein
MPVSGCKELTPAPKLSEIFFITTKRQPAMAQGEMQLSAKYIDLKLIALSVRTLH